MQEKKSAGIGKGTPGPGRPKGVPNKLTLAAKDAIAQVAEGLGGVERMIEWAKEDPLNELAYSVSLLDDEEHRVMTAALDKVLRVLLERWACRGGRADAEDDAVGPGLEEAGD